MTTPAFQSAVEAMKSGSAQGFLSLEMIKNLPLLDLPLQTQRNIAAILTSYDDLIENNKCRITLLENMAEEIYREWFVRFRFPGWQEAEFEKGQPIAWTHQKIAQAFDFTGGGTPSKDNDSFWRNGNVDWYTPSDITKSNSLFMASSEYQCNEEGLRRSSARLFPAYSVMMTSRATIGAIGINSKPACTNQGFITCIPNEQYPLTYLYHWLKAAKPHFEMLSGGATFPELIKSTFKRIEILSPDQGVIEKFDELVSPMFKKMETLAVQNRKLEQTKNQLLPRLISGKLSVENLDIQFPPSMQSDQSDNADEAAA
jgi:type I restriction enzyme S subunit